MPPPQGLLFLPVVLSAEGLCPCGCAVVYVWYQEGALVADEPLPALCGHDSRHALQPHRATTAGRRPPCHRYTNTRHTSSPSKPFTSTNKGRHKLTCPFLAPLCVCVFVGSRGPERVLPDVGLEARATGVCGLAQHLHPHSTTTHRLLHQAAR